MVDRTDRLSLQQTRIFELQSKMKKALEDITKLEKEAIRLEGSKCDKDLVGDEVENLCAQMKIHEDKINSN